MAKQTNILEIKEQKFEFDSPLKTKYIREMDSLIFNLVLLKNGDVYSLVYNDWTSKYKLSEKIDENCKFLDLVGDPNYTTSIYKTDNNLHYFVRHIGDIDNKDIDISLYYKKVPLTDELKNNKLIPYYVKKKFDKNNDLYSFRYQLTQIVYDEEANDTKLIGLSKDYFLYDYEQKVMYVDMDGLIIKIQLDDSSYGGEKKVMGYEKFLYKKNGNYIIFKSKNKKFVSIFTNKNWDYKDGTTDKNLFEINGEFIFRGNSENEFGRGESYFKNGRNIKDDYSGKGTNLFKDGYLPHFIDVLDRGDTLVFGYTDTKEKLTIPKKFYESVKKSSFKK